MMRVLSMTFFPLHRSLVGGPYHHKAAASASSAGTPPYRRMNDSRFCCFAASHAHSAHRSLGRPRPGAAGNGAEQSTQALAFST
jgi:hypothetical protein